MALEQQTCCGAVTHTYGDAGKRKHYEGCEYATSENTIRRPNPAVGLPLVCCGAPRMTSAQTGQHFHFEGCRMADPDTPAIERPDGPYEPVDPAESRKMTVAVEILSERGLWMAYCRETGMNDWARNEGQVRDGELLPLTEAQAVRIGLLAKPGRSSW